VAEYRTVAAIRSEFLSTLWYVAGRRGLHLATPTPDVAATPPALARELRDAAPEGVASEADLAARLEQLGTFQRPRSELLSLVADARFELYRSGEVVLAPGRQSDRAYVVVKGKAQATSSNDPAIVACTFAAGDLILFKSFFRGGDSPFVVRGSSDLEVISLSMTQLERALLQDARLAQQVERLLAAREVSTKRVLALPSESDDADSAGGQDRALILKRLFQA
jgi:CRP-like cAMP-binding protein